MPAHTQFAPGSPLLCAILVFAKAPEPGRVKTRLCPPLTPEAAAELHQACLGDLWERLATLEPWEDVDDAGSLGRLRERILARPEEFSHLCCFFEEYEHEHEHEHEQEWERPNA